MYSDTIMFKYGFFETNNSFRFVVEPFVVSKSYLLKNDFYCRLLKKCWLHNLKNLQIRKLKLLQNCNKMI